MSFIARYVCVSIHVLSCLCISLSVCVSIHVLSCPVCVSLSVCVSIHALSCQVCTSLSKSALLSVNLYLSIFIVTICISVCLFLLFIRQMSAGACNSIRLYWNTVHHDTTKQISNCLPSSPPPLHLPLCLSPPPPPRPPLCLSPPPLRKRSWSTARIPYEHRVQQVLGGA